MNQLELPKQYTKSAVSEIVFRVVQKAEAGEIHPVEAFTEAHMVADLGSELKKGLLPLAIDEMTDGHWDYRGAHAELRNLSSAWQYSHDEGWRTLETQISDLLAKRKTHEELMRAAARANLESIVNPETGEIVLAAKETPRGKTIAVSYQR